MVSRCLHFSAWVALTDGKAVYGISWSALPEFRETRLLVSRESRRRWKKWISPRCLIPWRRKWQPTPVFLPGEFQGQRSLVGYSPWGRKDSDMTEQLRAALIPRKKTAWSWLRKLPIMFHFYLFLLFFPCEVTRWSSHTVNQHHVLVDYSVFFNLEILSNCDSAKEIAIKTGNYIKKKKANGCGISNSDW